MTGVPCPDCSAERGGPVHFGEGPDGSPVELRPATGAGVDRGDPARTRRRLPRTIAVGVVGLGVIFYLATAYSWFDASVWGGVAFFALFALVAVAYRADDNTHRRRARQQPIG